MPNSPTENPGEISGNCSSDLLAAVKQAYGGSATNPGNGHSLEAPSATSFFQNEKRNIVVNILKNIYFK